MPVLSARFPVLSATNAVLSTRMPVPSATNAVLSTRMPVLSTLNAVPSARFPGYPSPATRTAPRPSPMCSQLVRRACGL